MNIQCSKEKLIKALSIAERISGKNFNLPILNCILLEVEGNGLKIKSTNLDLGLEIQIPVKASEGGIAAVSGGVINGLVSNLREDKLGIRLEENKLIVSTLNTSSSIKTLPSEEFPIIPKISQGKEMKVRAGDLVSGIRSVWYSAATSSMKPELSSVYIYYSEEGEMVFAATDSFRLAEKKVKTKKMENFGQILIPFKNTPEIIRLLEERGEEEEVSISLDKDQMSFFISDVYLTSRVIDGVFPDYNQIIPKEFKAEVTVLKRDFIDALRLTNIFSDKFNQVNIKISPKEKVFQIKSQNQDIGEIVNKIESATEGEDIEINFNHKYLTDCLQSINSDSLSLRFAGLSKPMIVEGVSDKTFTYLVMPMNK